MMSLTCQNVDFGRTRFDLVTCGCSSRKNFSRWIHTSGTPTRRFETQKVVGSKSCVCLSRVFSAKSPEAVLKVVPQDPASVFDAKSNSNIPILVSSLLEVVADDLLTLNKNLQTIVGAENPVLISAAEQIFSAGGKRMRPALVFLVSRATTQMAELKEINSKHRRLAEIIEMIHTASLIHDDVLDDSGMRRGMPFKF